MNEELWWVSKCFLKAQRRHLFQRKRRVHRELLHSKQLHNMKSYHAVLVAAPFMFLQLISSSKNVVLSQRNRLYAFT